LIGEVLAKVPEILSEDILCYSAGLFVISPMYFDLFKLQKLALLALHGTRKVSESFALAIVMVARAIK
jgi:hypothetical protein